MEIQKCPAEVRPIKFSSTRRGVGPLVGLLSTEAIAHSDKIILAGTLGEHSRAVFIVPVRESEELLVEIRKNSLDKKAKSIGEVETKYVD